MVGPIFIVRDYSMNVFLDFRKNVAKTIGTHIQILGGFRVSS